MNPQNPTPKIIAPGTYLHVKSGKKYEVIGVALETETSEQLVIYRPLYESKYALFARPYELFTGDVEIDGAKTPRFQRCD